MSLIEDQQQDKKFKLKKSQIEVLYNIKMSQTNLRSKFTLWILDVQKTRKQQTTETFVQKQKPVITFSTIEEFWHFFQYMIKPSKMTEQNEFYLFKQGIKPLWEDPQNEKGGYYKISIEKQRADKLWENAALALISPMREVATCINGVRVKIKQNLCMLQIWMNAKANDNSAELKQYMKDSLQIYDDKAFGFFYFSYLVKGIKDKEGTTNKQATKQDAKDGQRENRDWKNAPREGQYRNKGTK